MGADHIQEVTVVRNNDHGAVTLVQHLLQPANGIDVQVVRRFVEQQDVRIGKQRLRQQYTQFPAWGHFAHRTVMLFNRNPDAEQQFACARFGGVTVHLAILRFEIGDFIAVLFAHFGQTVDTVTLLLHFPQFSVAHDHGIEDGEFFKSELILAQLTDAFIWIERDIPQRRL